MGDEEASAEQEHPDTYANTRTEANIKDELKILFEILGMRYNVVQKHEYGGKSAEVVFTEKLIARFKERGWITEPRDNQSKVI